MNTLDRFAPPKANLDAAPDTAGAKAAREGIPWLFLLRYLVGAFVLISGLISLYGLCRSWASLVDRSVIEPLMSPYRLLPVILLKIATGVAILAKTKHSLALTLVWTVAFLYVICGNGPLRNLGAEFFLNVIVLIGLFAFQCLLLTRRLLR